MTKSGCLTVHDFESLYCQANDSFPCKIHFELAMYFFLLNILLGYVFLEVCDTWQLYVFVVNHTLLALLIGTSLESFIAACVWWGVMFFTYWLFFYLIFLSGFGKDERKCEDESKHVLHNSLGRQLDSVRWNLANQDEVCWNCLFISTIIAGNCCQILTSRM